jgi:hemolysin activation/secretion protein
MNYINQLKQKIESLNNSIIELQDEEMRMRLYLLSDKFQGFENKFVNPDDIIRMLDDVRTIIQNSEVSIQINTNQKPEGIVLATI